MNTQANQPAFSPLDATAQPSPAGFQATVGEQGGPQDTSETNATDDYGTMTDTTIGDDDMPASDPDDDMDDDDMDEDDSGEMEPETPDEIPDTRNPGTEMPSQRDTRM